MKLNISTIIATTLLACAGIEAKLTESQIHDLVELHKSARAAVHASDMKSISWDSSLAAKAQSYSALCKGMVHSGEGPENLAGSTTGDVTRMFNNWMKEKAGFDKSGYRASLKDISYGNDDIGHYSQIVWAANTKVGCGLSYCENFFAKYLLVCRYGTGNVLNQQVYAVGSSNEGEHKEEKKTTTVPKHTEERKTTTTTHKPTTTTTVHKTTTTTTVHKTTTTEEHKATPVSEPEKPSNNEEKKDNNEEKKDNNEGKKENNSPSASEKPSTPSQGITMPTVDSNVRIGGNSTVVNDDSKTSNTDNNNNNKPDDKNSSPSETIVKSDGTVETKNINDNYKKDGIIDEVGPSGYDSGNGTIVTGVAISGSVIGAAAAFVFYKKNPQQYKQLTKNMKTIQRGLTKRANTFRQNASVVTRKITMKKQNSSSNIQKRNQTTLDSSDYSINTSSDCSIDNMPMMTEMLELPEENTNYRSELSKSLEN